MRLNKLLYQIPAELQAFVYVNQFNSKVLVFQNIQNNILFYIKVPANIFYSIKNTTNFFFFSFSLKFLNSFLTLLSKQVSILRFPFFIKLFLKGLGFRIKLLELNNTRFLEFKLGFSHAILLNISSKNISVTVKKNSLILSGFLKTEVGNLANRIYNLKTPNIYTGKGFRYKRVSLKLKDVKKT